MFTYPEKFRDMVGPVANAFKIPQQKTQRGFFFLAVASSFDGWEHVSVTIPSQNRCPTWEEMCYIKDLFWSKDTPVVQFHPAEEDYISMHKYCLHLWRPIDLPLPTPKKALVGWNPNGKRV